MVTPQHVELINMCFSEYLNTFHVYSVEYLSCYTTCLVELTARQFKLWTNI